MGNHKCHPLHGVEGPTGNPLCLSSHLSFISRGQLLHSDNGPGTPALLIVVVGASFVTKNASCTVDMIRIKFWL